MAPGRLLKSFAENADAVIESEPCTSGNRTIGSVILCERKTTHAPKAETKKERLYKRLLFILLNTPSKKNQGGGSDKRTPFFRIRELRKFDLFRKHER